MNQFKSIINYASDYTLIYKATSEDNEPTPGYLYNELVNVSNRSVESCQSLLDNLTKRLKTENPVVKLKVLRVIKHIVFKGHPSFKKELIPRVDIVQNCLHYKGTPDPLTGDTPYQLVRQEAKEVLNGLFNTATTSISNSSTDESFAYSTPKTRIMGFGSDNLSAGIISHSSYSSTPSSNFTSNSTPTFSASTHTPYTPTPQPSQPLDFNAKRLLYSSAKTNELSNFGKLSSDNEDYTTHKSAVYSGPESFTTSPNVQSTPSSSSSFQIEISSEEKTVNEITQPNGAVNLSGVTLAQFCSYVTQLDVQLVCELLNKKLIHKMWQSRQKALACILALLTQSDPRIAEQTQIFFTNNYHNVLPLVSSVHKGLQEKSKQTLSILGLKIENQQAQSTPTNYAPPIMPSSEDNTPPIIEDTPQNQKQDLLLIDDDFLTNTELPKVTTTTTTSTSPSSNSISNGNHKNELDELFSFGSTQQAPSQPQPQPQSSPPSSSSLFNGLNLVNTQEHQQSTSSTINKAIPLSSTSPIHPQQKIKITQDDELISFSDLSVKPTKVDSDFDLFDPYASKNTNNTNTNNKSPSLPNQNSSSLLSGVNFVPNTTTNVLTSTSGKVSMNAMRNPSSTTSQTTSDNNEKKRDAFQDLVSFQKSKIV